MAFNPNAITNADPFGAFLTGNVIGREQNRADDAMALQEAQNQRAQDQFDWAKNLRPGQERMQELTLEDQALINARRALEGKEFADFAPYRQRAAQRGDVLGGLTTEAAQLTTIPTAKAQAAQAAATQQYALPMAESALAGSQADVGYRNAATTLTNDQILSQRLSRFMTPMGYDPNTGMVQVDNGQGGSAFIPRMQWEQTMGILMNGMTGGAAAQPQGQTDPFGFPVYGAPAPVAQPQAPQPAAAPQPRTMESAANLAADLQRQLQGSRQ